MPATLNATGSAGERPQPPYPKIALDQGQQGSVLLRMSVDDAGLIRTIEVAHCSGFQVLDHSALEFVKRHWTVPTGQASRLRSDNQLQTSTQLTTQLYDGKHCY